MSGWVAGAIVVGAVVSSQASKSAAKTQANAARDASQLAKDSADASVLENRRQYDLSRSDMAPTMERGNLAGNRLQGLMGLGANSGLDDYGSLMQRFTGAQLANEPGYQFGLQQGQRGLDNSSAAHGGHYSGAQLKAASRYNNDYASTKYGDAYNRYNNDQTNTFNRLSGIAGSGQQANAQIGQFGAQMAQNNAGIMNNYASTAGNNMMGAANARASSYLSQGNSLQNALNQGGSALKNYYSSPPPRTGATSGDPSGSYYDGYAYMPNGSN
jgi:hypothetical protein